MNNQLLNNTTPSLSTSEFALLAFLMARPSHGYELHKKTTDSEGAGMIWDVKISNLYAQLDKLAQRGLIQGSVLESEQQRPARTAYALTGEGRTLIERWLHEPVETPRDFRHDFLIRVFFLSQYQPQELGALIDKQLSLCQRWLNNIFGDEKPAALTDNFADLTRHFRYSQIQSMIEWLTWLKNQVPIIQINRGEQ